MWNLMNSSFIVKLLRNIKNSYFFTLMTIDRNVSLTTLKMIKVFLFTHDMKKKRNYIQFSNTEEIWTIKLKYWNIWKFTQPQVFGSSITISIKNYSNEQVIQSSFYTTIQLIKMQKKNFWIWDPNSLIKLY